MITAIVGANWGDEGKGKITDLLAGQSDYVVRFQGGSNAGHTIIHEAGKFVLHLLPSGVFYPNVTNIIGTGTALNVDFLRGEIEALAERGVKVNLKVSMRAGLLMPYHVLLDVYEEERLGKRQFGSTKSGIAPFYADKHGKNCFKVWQLYYDDSLRDSVESLCERLNVLLRHLYAKPELEPEAVYNKLMEYAEFLRPYAEDTDALLRQAEAEDKKILFEGQLGSLRDVEHGIYPYVTSSSTLAGYASVGAGSLPPGSIRNIIAVTKAYSSAVGAGPFVSEIFGAEADELRRRGGDAGEYGATTGRPRRMGWFDTVATRYGCAVQGATEAVLTGLDVLGYLDEIPVCVEYENDGKRTGEFSIPGLLYKSRPVLKKLPGWKCDIRGVKSYSELPAEARAYVEFIEREIGVPIKMVSHGPRRDELLVRL